MEMLTQDVGLTADGRVLIDKARIECQSHRLTVEDPVTVEYITRHIAGIQQVSGLSLPLDLLLNVRAALHSIWRRSTVRCLYSHRWLRPSRRQATIVPDRTRRYLQRLEGTSIIHRTLYFRQAEHRFQANAIGRSSKTVREFLEKNHKDDMSRDDTIKLTVKSLLEVVQTGAKNIEISVMESYGKITVCYCSS